MSGRIYLASDTHGQHDIKKITTEGLRSRNVSLDQGDYLIILGDWGVVWDRMSTKGKVQRPDTFMLHWYESKPWTTIVVLGNHENYDAYENLPLSEWNGALVWRLAPNVIVVKSGQMFTLNDEKFFVMGGASSIDRLSRVNHISWWAQELPTYREVEDAIDLLETYGFQFDYLLTHCAPTELHQKIVHDPTSDCLTDMLSWIKMRCDFKYHYFGHYHIDQIFTDENATCLYNMVVELN